jgi:hypothetical protein
MPSGVYVTLIKGDICRLGPSRRSRRTCYRVYRPLADHKPQRTVGVIWRQRRYHSATAERFFEGLRVYAVEQRRAAQ